MLTMISNSMTLGLHLNQHGSNYLQKCRILLEPYIRNPNHRSLFSCFSSFLSLKPKGDKFICGTKPSLERRVNQKCSFLLSATKSNVQEESTDGFVMGAGNEPPLKDVRVLDMTRYVFTNIT